MSHSRIETVNLQFLKQSLCDETFYEMTPEEFDERCNRLSYKSLNGIVDAETVAADFRMLRNLTKQRGIKAAAQFIEIFLIKNNDD